MSKKETPWRLVPFYGLQLVGAQLGNTSPIFSGDATVIGIEATAQAAATVVPKGVDVFIGSGMRGILETLPVRPPMKNFLEFQPHSFIAVRRRKEEVQEYSESILAMLTASVYYTTRMICGFYSNPLSGVWGFPLTETGWNEDIRFEATRDFLQNVHIHHLPIQITEENLRRSWNEGSSVSGSWRVSKEDLISSLFVGRMDKLNPMQKELREAGITISCAYSAWPYSAQILHAVASIEQIFQTNQFKELKNILYCLFPGEGCKQLIDDIIERRHHFTHRAKELSDKPQTQKKAEMSLRLAWMCLDIALRSSEIFKTKEDWCGFLHQLVSAEQLAYFLDKLMKKEEIARTIRSGILPASLCEFVVDPLFQQHAMQL